MAPIPGADLDGDHPSSDVGDSQDSPLRRQFSEPLRPLSTSTQISQSPDPMPRRIKCDWCGKLLQLPANENISEDDVLAKHSKEAHPKPISFAGYDDADDGDGTEDGAEDGADDGAEDGVDDTYDENGDLQDEDAIESVEPTTEAANGEAQVEESGDIPVEVTPDDPSGTKATETPTDDSNTPPKKFDLLEWLSNPRTSYPEDNNRRTAEWSEPDIKKRLPRFWNVHDTQNFFPDYEEEATKWESALDTAFHNPSNPRPKKRDAPEDVPHPRPYKMTRVDKGEFLPIQTEELDSLVTMLRNPESYTFEELHALTGSAAFAMRAIQEEYLALDRLYLLAHRHKRDPASFEMKRNQMEGNRKKGGPPLAKVALLHLDFEDQKEAMLYGYKHVFFKQNSPTTVARTLQDPFVQGGFVPTASTAKKLAAKSLETGNRNLDRWPSMTRGGVEYHPQMYEPRHEPVPPKNTRKRKATEVDALTKTTEAAESQDDDETEEDTRHAAKRRTRGRGGKAAVAESVPPESNSRRGGGAGSGRGRGRGRGRGTGRPGSSRATFEAAPAPTQTSSRGRGRRGAATLASSATPSAETSVFPAVAEKTAASPATDTQVSAKKEPLSAEAAEEARAQKIANSKNPKRTKAMLDHWARFNREGRTRMPKRSKAQIEQDRLLGGLDGASDDATKPSGHGRRKRSSSLAPLAGNLAPKGAPSLPPMASVQAQPQQPMPPTLPPMGVVPHYGPGPVNPYAAAPVAPMAQLGQPMPPQYAPFPYVPYGMNHLPGHNPGGPRH
ncbi:uncharacterized protein N7515_001586 [Penicillium bovifimosum]|uniref:Uncharacterized protein n=1 Tax=Penicillium bovifimosum TaxID=126998 RepID=A0A9W9L8U9_9EURO|nr:uncharacterized protein N7515_001586 [Penicillium bovifimosum]KAJ5142799.1 hypothetical protein N7515_001586 [Penicillium bovifimosum]